MMTTERSAPMFRRSALVAVSAVAVLALSSCGILGDDSSEPSESPTATSSQSTGKDDSVTFKKLLDQELVPHGDQIYPRDLSGSGYDGRPLQAGQLPANLLEKYPWRIGLMNNGDPTLPAKNSFRVWWGCTDKADSIDIISSNTSHHGIEFPDLQDQGYPESRITGGTQDILMTMNGSVDTDNICEYVDKGNYAKGWNLKKSAFSRVEFSGDFPR